ncbi:MAG: hypothetical protein CM1200mP16_10200 [Nitrospina sp.]|nr:MAG: hypothetical protein CM1200mP16_10200 [Nitrospina sp.]
MALNYFLLVIPQNRFCEEELYDLKGVLNQGPGKCVVLSKSGKEAKGENKTILQPDGMLVDWNRHLIWGNQNMMLLLLLAVRVLVVLFGRIQYYPKFLRIILGPAKYWAPLIYQLLR